MEYPNKTWYRKWWGILAIMILAIVLFFMAASAAYFVGEIKNAKLKLNQPGLNLSGQTYDAASGDHYWQGSEKAKITIVEFGDFACPACEKDFPTIRGISQTYKNDIKFIWRDFPVVSSYSETLALAARCAGEQGLFWLMHDKLFQNQGAGQTDDLVIQSNELVALANQIGADLTKFKNCFDQKKYLPQIEKDLSDGQSFGITGTPTYFINDYEVKNDITYDTLAQKIEQLKK